METAGHADSAEHQLLGDLLDAQAAQGHAAVSETADNSAANKAVALGSAVAAVAESTLRVDAARIDSVMNLVGELIIGKSMLNRALSEFDQKHSRDPVRAKLVDALSFQARVLDELHKSVLKIRMVPSNNSSAVSRAWCATSPSIAEKTWLSNSPAKIPISTRAFSTRWPSP